MNALERLAAIGANHRRRQDFLRVEGSLSRQIKAFERRAKKRRVDDQCPIDAQEKGVVDAVLQPFIEARDNFHRLRYAEERELVKLVEALPLHESFIEPTCGLGALGVGQLIAEAGDPGAYDNPAKLWKRFGVGLVDGHGRQRKARNKKLAALYAYNPRRRSVLYVVTDSLLKKQNHYRDLYDERIVTEHEKAAAEGLEIAPAATANKHPEKYRSKAHVRFRAHRYVSKRLLRDLWRAWRDQAPRGAQKQVVSPGTPLSSAGVGHAMLQMPPSDTMPIDAGEPNSGLERARAEARASANGNVSGDGPRGGLR